jgi:stalled ribosome rescue protein Dom34
MNYVLHAVGTRVRYFGDVSNLPGEGVIVGHHHSVNWGGGMNITLNDGREMWNIKMSNFVTPGVPRSGERFEALD